MGPPGSYFPKRGPGVALPDGRTDPLGRSSRTRTRRDIGPGCSRHPSHRMGCVAWLPERDLPHRWHVLPLRFPPADVRQQVSSGCRRNSAAISMFTPPWRKVGRVLGRAWEAPSPTNLAHELGRLHQCRSRVELGQASRRQSWQSLENSSKQPQKDPPGGRPAPEKPPPGKFRDRFPPRDRAGGFGTGPWWLAVCPAVTQPGCRRLPETGAGLK
jgi:hypothetical protein